MKTIRSFKFSRNPQFIPTGLTDAQLSDIEEAVYSFLEARQEEGQMVFVEKYDKFQIGQDMHNGFLSFHGKPELPECFESANEAAWIYAGNCANFIIVCGARSGLWSLKAHATNRTYAMAMGYV